MAKSDLEINMICHDRHLRDTVFLDESGNTIFALDCAALFTSWTVRRTLRDAAGSVCLQVRHEKLGMQSWVIEDAHGKPVCEAKGSRTVKTRATRIEAKVLAGPEAGSTVVLQSVDRAGSSTTFDFGGRDVAEMALTKNNDMSFLGRRGGCRSRLVLIWLWWRRWRCVGRRCYMRGGIRRLPMSTGICISRFRVFDSFSVGGKVDVAYAYRVAQATRRSESHKRRLLHIHLVVFAIVLISIH